jgi:ubiquinol oxidase
MSAELSTSSENHLARSSEITASHHPLHVRKHDEEWRWESPTLAGHAAIALISGAEVLSNAYFKERYASKALLLETAASIPGEVGALFTRFSSLRNMEPDRDYREQYRRESDNEHLHLLVFNEIAKPTRLEKAMIVGMQIGVFASYSALYLANPQAAHRFVAELERGAVESYTKYIEAIDRGEVENIPAPKIAIDAWKLPADARLRDVVVAVRQDEMTHRDNNHAIADKLAKEQVREKWEKKNRKKPPGNSPPMLGA